MRHVEFRVDNHLPPAKDGANSMWGKSTDAARRLIALRRAALRALEGQGPLEQNIRMTLRVHVGKRKGRSAGDLDNYITGICDGLQAANERSLLHTEFDVADMADVHPFRCIAISDDSAIISICAEKLSGQGDQIWYEVSLAGD